MAEETRTVIIDVEVESKDFDKEIGNVNNELEENRKLIKELKKDYAANSTEIAKLEAENRDLSKSKRELVKESNTEANSLDALRLKTANLTKERNGLDTSTQEGQRRFAELNKEIANNSEEISKAEQAGGDYRRNVGNYPETFEAIPGFKGLTAGIQTATKAAIAFIATPLGLVLGAVALAVSAVSAAFQDSEEGQNKFARLMGVINVVIGNFRDLLADLGEGIIEVFENPQQALEDFGNLLRDNIITRFEGILNFIPNIGRAIEELFAGNFAEAGKIAVDSLGQVALGVDSITESIANAAEASAEFFTQTINESQQAIDVANKRAEAERLNRELLVDRAKIESQVAELRLRSREEEQFNAEQRKAFLLEAQELQDTLLEREKEVLQLRADAQTLENTFSRSSIENLNLEAEAIAAVSQIEATRFNQQRQTQRELNRLNKEIAAEERKRQSDLEKEQNARFKREEKALQAHLDEQSKAEQQAAQEEKERQQQLSTVKQSLLDSTGNAIVSALGRSSRAGKLAASIQAGINIAEAVTKALASAPPPFNFAAATAVGVAGAVQLSKINNAKTFGGSGSGSSAGGGAGVNADGSANINIPSLGIFQNEPIILSDAGNDAASEDNIIQGATLALLNQKPPQVSVVDINEAKDNRDVKVIESNLEG